MFGLGLGRLGATGTRSLDAAIRALFSDGVIYDPSDLTTLFQDSAGTQPVTALEQPVGLMLDKSRGLVLGPELVTNGDFSDGTTGWTFASGWTVSGGKAAKSTPGTANAVSQTVSITSGKFYKVLFDVSGLTAGSVNLRLGSNATVLFSATANGSYSPIVFAQSADSVLYFYSGSTFDGSIDNISVRELPGNHAYHTPGDTTTRPTLSRRINLLTKTEQFDDAAWTKTAGGTGSAPVVTPNTAVAPDGTLTADTVVFDIGSGTTAADISNLLYTTLSYSAGVALTQSVYMRTPDGTSKVFTFVTIDGIAQTITVTDSWQRFSLSSTPAASSSNNPLRIRLRGNESTAKFASIYIWGASLVPADLAGLPYQRVNTTTDYDSDASKFPTFLRCDGTNDGMQTNAIDFTGTDKMFVGAAVRKLSDAAIACVLETSGGGFANSMSVFAPITAASPDYFFRTYGATGNASLRATTYTSPTTNVLSCSFNNASTSVNTAVLPRINGAIPSTTALFDTNTVGNYGNYPLYLFRRGGTSLPFNGWMFGLLVKGSALSASQIALAERWLAQKTRTVTLA